MLALNLSSSSSRSWTWDPATLDSWGNWVTSVFFWICLCGPANKVRNLGILKPETGRECLQGVLAYAERMYRGHWGPGESESWGKDLALPVLSPHRESLFSGGAGPGWMMVDSGELLVRWVSTSSETTYSVSANLKRHFKLSMGIFKELSILTPNRDMTCWSSQGTGFLSAVTQNLEDRVRVPWWKFDKIFNNPNLL